MEYAYALSQKGQLQDNLDVLLTCLAEVMRLEEGEVIPTDAALKELLVILESEKPANNLQLALAVP